MYVFALKGCAALPMFSTYVSWNAWVHEKRSFLILSLQKAKIIAPEKECGVQNGKKNWFDVEKMEDREFSSKGRLSTYKSTIHIF